MSHKPLLCFICPRGKNLWVRFQAWIFSQRSHHQLSQLIYCSKSTKQRISAYQVSMLANTSCLINPYHWMIFYKDFLFVYWKNSALLLREHLFSSAEYHAGLKEELVKMVAVGLRVVIRAYISRWKKRCKIGYHDVYRPFGLLTLSSLLQQDCLNGSINFLDKMIIWWLRVYPQILIFRPCKRENVLSSEWGE